MDRFRMREEMREEMAFLRAGIVASTIANVHLGPDAEPFAHSDFMPENFREKKHEPTREEVLASMRELNALLGGEDLTTDGKPG